ncbi:MAG TPA: PLP-dependent aspartate aminotransferase family protein [Bacteroidota bacterium]|nr:PLP-dependent aspartate aminotransferase family protein [Bacteroidota bacterium]
MKTAQGAGFATRAIHAGQEPDPGTGAIMTPVFLTSTYVQEELGRNKGYEYSRVSNPTRTALEKNIAALEGGAEGLAFGSGTAAVDAILRLMKPGDHVIMSQNVYGGTYRIAKMVWEEYGLRFSFVDTTDVRNIEAAVTGTSRMLFIETPTNPTIEISDLAACAALARSRGLLSVADNTFATPYLQQPLAAGFDVVVHSLTKYLNGHSDMLGGLVVTSDRAVAERLRFMQKAVGGILSPFDAWLCLRGTKTLAVRMKAHCENAITVARWLESRKGIQKVHYPGLKSHPGHALAGRQMRGFGGMISFELGSLAAAAAFLKNVRLCALAESLGGVESIITHPASMTHAAVPPEERRRIGVTDGLVRISVGLEDAEDIIGDLDAALAAAGI